MRLTFFWRSDKLMLRIDGDHNMCATGSQPGIQRFGPQSIHTDRGANSTKLVILIRSEASWLSIWYFIRFPAALPSSCRLPGAGG
jgi:hypothetical protein